MNNNKTHWAGCWKHKGHSACARRKVQELERLLAEAKKAIVWAHAELGYSDDKCLCKYCHPAALEAGEHE